MLHKSILNVICHRLPNILIPKRLSSLFINGHKATDNFVYVVPHIDYNRQVKENNNLKDELTKRKSDLNLDKLVNLWTIFEELQLRKKEMEKKKNKISKQLSELISTQPDSNEIQKIKIHLSLVKDNLNKLKVPFWSAEEAAVVEYLKVPNSIHKMTPENDNEILFFHLSHPHNCKNHMEVGNKLDLFLLKNNENYYLKGEAALFELGAKFYFTNILKQHNFLQFSNPDFVKSLIVEGCGLNHKNPDSTFILHHHDNTEVKVDNRLHLVGGGSLASFMSYYAKNLLYSKVLPLRYFSMGRQYIPSAQIENNLFHVSQSSVVELFVAAKTSEQADEVLINIIDLIKRTYSKFNVHFRLRFLPADKLTMWESLHLSVEMYSGSMKRYIEVANLSVSGDFISKRLMFQYTENKEIKFPHIISGTILNVPKFLGCILEQDCDFAMPEQFDIKNWSI